MKRIVPKAVLPLFYIFIAGIVSASEPKVQVEEAVVTTAIAERNPVDMVHAYPAAGARLYCFTRIHGAEQETSVSHVWYKGGQEIGRAILPVRSSNWRTWSVRTFEAADAGDWRVDILDVQGRVLVSIPFALTGG